MAELKLQINDDGSRQWIDSNTGKQYYQDPQGERFEMRFQGYKFKWGGPSRGIIRHGSISGSNTYPVYDFKPVKKVSRKKKIKRP